jgi:DNA-binding transcriptional regulator YhcF (GntR family)
LLQALPKAKSATMTSGSLTGDAVARALATDLGVSPAGAQRALRELFGAAARGAGAKSATDVPPDAALTALAARLQCV